MTVLEVSKDIDNTVGLVTQNKERNYKSNFSYTETIAMSNDVQKKYLTKWKGREELSFPHFKNNM